MANKTVTVTDNESGKSWNYPKMSGTTGPDVVDIRKFYADTGMFAFDPGFTSTGSCESKITYIDGDNGLLLHGGYPIEELAENCNFEEVAYLLLNGELPNEKQKEKFQHDLTYHTMLHEQVHSFYSGFRRDAHPMAVMCGVVAALSAFYHDSLDINNPEHRRIASYRLIAKIPTIAAWAYKYSIGQPFMYPRNDLGYAENFLHMMYATPCEDYTVSPLLAKAMDRILILHADHEQNGVASLWGPAHGGANEAVLNMLKEIGTKDNVNNCVKRAKDKNDNFRLMGFGHRVYKNYDPRARIMSRTCHEVLGELGIKDNPLLDIAMELERIALEDEYFIQKKLYPNVDFYSGIIFQAMNIPVTMFTPLFALARTTGWIAQWNEMIEDPQNKIGRPRQLYTGQTPRKYVPIKKRK